MNFFILITIHARPFPPYILVIRLNNPNSADISITIGLKYSCHIPRAAFRTSYWCYRQKGAARKHKHKYYIFTCQNSGSFFTYFSHPEYRPCFILSIYAHNHKANATRRFERNYPKSRCRFGFGLPWCTKIWDGTVPQLADINWHLSYFFNVVDIIQGFQGLNNLGVAFVLF